MTDPGTNLKGLSLSSPSTDPPFTVRSLYDLQEALMLAPVDDVPEIPAWITPITDIFLIRDFFEEPIEFRIPLSEFIEELPTGVSFTEVGLYTYSEIPEAGVQTWFPVAIGDSLEGTSLQDVHYVVDLANIQGFAFFGYHSSEGALPFEATPQAIGDLTPKKLGPGSPSSYKSFNVAMRVPPVGLAFESDSGLVVPRSIYVQQNNDDCEEMGLEGNVVCVTPPPLESITCEREIWDFGLLYDENVFACTYDGDPEVLVNVAEFGEGDLTEIGCRWTPEEESPTIELTGCAEGRSVYDLVIWTITAQFAMEEIGLAYNKKIRLHIHSMTNLLAHILGYDDVSGFVHPVEGRKTLHLTDDNGKSPEYMRFVLFHEYFHQAQGHNENKVSGGDYGLFISRFGGPAHWLTEGMATWFGDEPEDSLNAYNISPFPSSYSKPRIMETGLDSPQIGNSEDSYDARSNPYLRFSFFKLLSYKCGGFYSHLKHLHTDRSSDLGIKDKTGIKNLVRVMTEADCDFGDHMDDGATDGSATLAAAISYYNFATQFISDGSLLDPNETEIRFDLPEYRFAPSFPRNSPQSLPDGNSLIYTLVLNPDVGRTEQATIRIPPAGAYSASLPIVTGSLPDGTVSELIVVSDGGELLVSMAARQDLVDPTDFVSMNTIGPDTDLSRLVFHEGNPQLCDIQDHCPAAIFHSHKSQFGNRCPCRDLPPDQERGQRGTSR